MPAFWMFSQLDASLEERHSLLTALPFALGPRSAPLVFGFVSSRSAYLVWLATFLFELIAELVWFARWAVLLGEAAFCVCSCASLVVFRAVLLAFETVFFAVDRAFL